MAIFLNSVIKGIILVCPYHLYEAVINTTLREMLLNIQHKSELQHLNQLLEMIAKTPSVLR